MPDTQNSYLLNSISERYAANQELLRQLLCCFDTPENAKEGARLLMEQHDSLRYLTEVPASELKKCLPEFPDNAVIALLMLQELAALSRMSKIAGRRVLNAVDACEHMSARLFMEKQETVLLLILDKRMEVKSAIPLSAGGADRATLSPPDILAAALGANANCVLLGHNHPGGSATPSRADVDATKSSIQILFNAGIPLLDHIIVAGGKGVSLRASGLIDDALWLAQGESIPPLNIWKDN